MITRQYYFTSVKARGQLKQGGRALPKGTIDGAKLIEPEQAYQIYTQQLGHCRRTRGLELELRPLSHWTAF